MKELYIAPEVKLIGFVASEKMASGELSWAGFDVTLNNNTNISKTDIKIPITKLT